MNIMTVFVGIVFMILGGLSIANPKRAFEIRTFISRKFFGMSIKATPKTYSLYKFIGVLYIIIGLLFLVTY